MDLHSPSLSTLSETSTQGWLLAYLHLQLERNQWSANVLVISPSDTGTATQMSKRDFVGSLTCYRLDLLSIIPSTCNYDMHLAKFWTDSLGWPNLPIQMSGYCPMAQLNSFLGWAYLWCWSEYQTIRIFATRRIILVYGVTVSLPNMKLKSLIRIR